jgi:putative ABC transport system substrate-binding protein
MTSKIVTCSVLSVFLLPVSSAQAQQPKKVPRIGYISATDRATGSARSEAIRLTPRALGYVKDTNIAIEYDIRKGRSLFISGQS